MYDESQLKSRGEFSSNRGKTDARRQRRKARQDKGKKDVRQGVIVRVARNKRMAMQRDQISRASLQDKAIGAI